MKTEPDYKKLYEQAVEGRQQFRQALRNERQAKDDIDTIDELDGMERIERFDSFNNKKVTCRTCAYAMPFKTAVVCGVHHCTFSYGSLCDEYKTHAERQIELDKKRAEMLSDPNSFLNRFSNKSPC